MSVGDAHDLYVATLRRGDRKTLRPRTLADKEIIFKRDIPPRLGKTTIGKLTENECWDAVCDKAKAKDRANKMAGELSCFLRWCSGREGRMAGVELPVHPAPTLNSNWFSAGPKANRRFLSDEELTLLLQALTAEGFTQRRGVLLLLLLTAARRNELLAAPARELRDGVWTLPANARTTGSAMSSRSAPGGRS